MRLTLLAATALALAACGQPRDPTATASTEASDGSISGPAESAAETGAASAALGPLNTRFDCLRESGGILVIAHRGGPTRDYPENAIESFARTYKAGTHAMEIDIAETKDGKLVLMHDDDLDRTTTGTGLVVDHTLAEIQALKLKTDSKTTEFHPPTLQAALEWAVANHAFLELDKKRSASYAPIISAVRAAKAENNVLLITYTDDQAIEAQKAAPDFIINATLNSPDQLDKLLAAGLKPERLIAWTGNVEPRPELWSALAARGVESIFGTNGSRAEGLDYKYWDDGDGSEFNTLAQDGLPILVTGFSDKTSRQLSQEIRAAGGCGF
ncbi:MAG: glycerophosphodiester phosphodiesterase family protein [Hyphomonadaceae bacterium]